ncbi:hypothetical protein C813_04295 [Kosakonia sacchari SP1]|nr:hypothetical protein C813_04295 [Kosakonia sacchari SP1]
METPFFSIFIILNTFMQTTPRWQSACHQSLLQKIIGNILVTLLLPALKNPACAPLSLSAFLAFTLKTSRPGA